MVRVRNDILKSSLKIKLNNQKFLIEIRGTSYIFKNYHFVNHKVVKIATITSLACFIHKITEDTPVPGMQMLTRKWDREKSKSAPTAILQINILALMVKRDF
jgi:hypothetical protein